MRATSDPPGHIWAALLAHLQFSEQGRGHGGHGAAPHPTLLPGQETLELPLVQQARREVGRESRGAHCTRRGVRVTLPSGHPGRATGPGCGTELSGAGPGAGLGMGLCQAGQ